MVTEPLLGNNGHEPQEETQEQLDLAYKNLKDLKGPDGQLVTLGKQELSLLKQILSANTEEYKKVMFWRMLSFMNEDEAHNHVAAFYEAEDLGMDTNFNIAYAFALCSVNRKGAFVNNLIALMSDTVQMGKHAWTPPKKGNYYDHSNQRSPIKD